MKHEIPPHVGDIARVMKQWAQWRKIRAVTGHASQLANFQKGDAELAVFGYGNQCVVLKKTRLPNGRMAYFSFREWSQKFSTVMAKLAASKWEILGVKECEVRNAH